MKKYGKLKILGIFILAIYTSYIFINQEMIAKRQEQEIEHLNKELSVLKEEKLILQDKMQIKDNNKYIEKMAREKLGLVKSGEEPIIILYNIDENGEENNK